MQWFFYGTLLDPDIRRHVFPHVAEALTLRPAELGGYRRYRCHGASYPVVVPRRGGRVPGLLAEGLDERAVLRVAHFEGAEYQPRQVELRLAGGGRTRAWLFMPLRRSLATRELWTFDRWRRIEKRRIMPQVRFWMNQCGVETLSSPELVWHVRRQIRRIALNASAPLSSADQPLAWPLAA